jgi:hypothetical protein
MNTSDLPAEAPYCIGCGGELTITPAGLAHPDGRPACWWPQGPAYCVNDGTPLDENEEDGGLCLMNCQPGDRAALETAWWCDACAAPISTPGGTCANGHDQAARDSYNEWAGGGEEMCGAGFTTGPAHDPYGTGCEYSRRDHPRRDGGALLHRGGAPLGGPGDMVEWTGGGTCAGDPLPHTVVRYLWACPLAPEPVADEDLGAHMRRVHGWTIFAHEEDDTSTLRAMHGAALANLAAAAPAGPPPAAGLVREQQIAEAIGRAAEALAEAADRSPGCAAEGEVVGVGDGTSGFLMRFEGALVRVTVGPATEDEEAMIASGSEA